MLSRDHHARQVELYAEFNPDKLLDFLRISNSYSLEQALKTCRDRKLTRQEIFLLGRMGNHRQALRLVIEQLGDVRMAIEYVSEQDDTQLWRDLIKASMKRPEFLSALLVCGHPAVDPVELVRDISERTAIPELKPTLQRVIQDTHIQVFI